METWKRILLKAAGFGAGSVLAMALLVAIAYMWVNRPKHWSDKAITAKFAELSAQRTGEEFHFEIQYAITNNTNAEYSFPSQYSGNLMRRLSDANSVAKVGEASWDDSVRIPPGQSVTLTFTVPIKLADFNKTSADFPEPSGEHPSQEYVDFVNRRLKEMDGFVFYDFNMNYRILLPSGWKRSTNDMTYNH